MSDVIGSASFELRATRQRLQRDIADAEGDLKRSTAKIKADADRSSRELKRAFSDAGQDEFTRSMRIIERASEHTEKDVRQAADRVARDLKNRYRDLGTGIGQTFAGISTSAQIALAGVTAYSLKLAADAAEIESAFDVAFTSASADARAFADELGGRVGRDSVELREKMTRLQLVLTGTGVAADQAAMMVKKLTEIGVDAGSLFNVSDAEALQKIVSGLTGESEPLKAFGVVITETAVQAELLRLGFKGNASEASEAAKSIARANLIIKGLAVAQGDAARTSGSAANQARAMRAEFNAAARDLGQQLIPMMTQLFGVTTNTLKAFNDLPGGVQIAGLALLALVAAGGPIAAVAGGLGRLIVLARQTQIALAGVTGAQAAAGAGRLGGLAVGIGVGTAVAAGTLGYESYSNRQRDSLVNRLVGRDSERLNTQTGRFENPTLRSAPDAEIAVALRQVQSNRGDYSSRANRYAETLQAEQTRRSQAQQASAAAAAAQVTAAGAAAAGSVATGGGFSLPQNLRSAPGSDDEDGRRGRARTGPSEEELAAQREMLRLQASIELARAQGRDADARAGQMRVDILTLTKQLSDAGVANAEVEARAQVTSLARAQDAARGREAALERTADLLDLIAEAQERSNELSAIQLNDQIEIARASGDEGLLRNLVREEEIRARIADLMRLTPGLSRADAQQQAVTATDNRIGAERVGNLRDEFRSAFSGGIQAAIDGDLGGFFENLADRFTDRMLDNLANNLFDLLQSAVSAAGKKEGGGFSLANIGSTIASAFRGLQPGSAAGAAPAIGPVVGGVKSSPFGPIAAPAIDISGISAVISGGFKSQSLNIVSPLPSMKAASEAVTPGMNAGLAAGSRDLAPRSMGDTYHFSGNLLTPEFMAQIDGKVARGEARAVGKSVNLTRRGAAGMQQRMARLGTT